MERSQRVHTPEGARGFTLAELVVALSLGAVLAGLGVLGHDAVRDRLALWQAARQVALELNLTRMRAIRENRDQRLHFRVTAAEYQRQRLEHGVFVDVGGPVALPSGTVVAGCNAPEEAIRFRPRGNALQFGTITLRNRRRQERRVIVSIAGHVRLE